MRWVEMQLWPAWENPATRILAAAPFQSPSGSMITGALLPSSKPTRLRGARARMLQPTGGEPVKVMRAMSGWSTIGVAHGPAAARDDVELIGRQAALVDEQLGQRDGGERRLAGRLQHHRTTGRDGRSHLVHDEVQREVERRDGPDDADRHSQCEAQLALTGRAGVERHHLPHQLARLGGGKEERASGPLRFDPRRLDGLSRLGGDDAGEVLTTLGEEPGRGIEHRGPLPQRERAGPERSLGRGHRAIYVQRGARRHLPEDGAVVGRVDRDGVVGGVALTGQGQRDGRQP